MRMKKNVYIVEDNEDIRDLIGYILVGEHYEVTMYPDATSFTEAIALAQPDVIVLDIMLPDGNGMEVCKQLKADKQYAAIPVILMSANAQKKDMFNEACAEDFIAKPFNIDDFQHRVERDLE